VADDRDQDDEQQPPGGQWAPFGPGSPGAGDDEQNREQHPPPGPPKPVFEPPTAPTFVPPANAPPPVDQPPQAPPPQAPPGYGAPRQEPQPGYGAPPPPPLGYGAPPPPGYGQPQQPGYGAPPPGYGGQPGYGAPPPGYGPPQYGYGVQPYVAKKTNGFAVASLILGALWLYWLGSILALIFGYIAKSQIEKSGGMQDGRGLAIAGIVLGWIGVAVLAITVVAVLAGA
jgi:hypothetical protein